MTHEEWERYMGTDVLYRLTCPNLPFVPAFQLIIEKEP